MNQNVAGSVLAGVEDLCVFLPKDGLRDDLGCVSRFGRWFSRFRVIDGGLAEPRRDRWDR